MSKNQYISFSDPQFFGQAFTQKYNEFKANQKAQLNFQVNIREVMGTLQRVVRAENGHREELERLAVQTAKDLFPVIEETGIQIDAKLSDRISHSDLTPRGTPNFPKSPPKNNPELYKKIAKQKILNAITQGAGVSMNSIHHMNSEQLANIGPSLTQDYDKLMKSNEVAYFEDPDGFVPMAIMANNHGDIGGTNKVEFRDHVPYVVAIAKNYVNLVHEIVKGVYTYLTLNAYKSEEEYYEVTEYTDSIYSEIEDIGSGKMILNMLRDYLMNEFEKYYDHPCFFEMFLVAFSKQEADDVVSLTNGLLNGTPNRAKFEVLARNCYYDLKDFEKKKSRY